jgi:hypothetical protein
MDMSYGFGIQACAQQNDFIATHKYFVWEPRVGRAPCSMHFGSRLICNGGIN